MKFRTVPTPPRRLDQVVVGNASDARWRGVPATVEVVDSQVARSLARWEDDGGPPSTTTESNGV